MAVLCKKMYPFCWTEGDMGLSSAHIHLKDMEFRLVPFMAKTQDISSAVQFFVVSLFDCGLESCTNVYNETKSYNRMARTALCLL